MDLYLRVCDQLAQSIHFGRKVLKLELEVGGLGTGTDLRDVEGFREERHRRYQLQGSFGTVQRVTNCPSFSAKNSTCWEVLNSRQSRTAGHPASRLQTA